MPVGRQHLKRHYFPQVVQPEYVLNDGRLVHAVGDEKDPAGLRDPHSLGERLPLVLARVEVIHRPEQHRQREGGVRQVGEIHGVALQDGDRLGAVELGPEQLEVVRHQLHGGHPVALPRKRDAVPSRSRADLQNAWLRDPGEILVNVFHCGEVFDLPVSGQKPAFLVVAVIIILKIAHDALPEQMFAGSSYHMPAVCTRRMLTAFGREAGTHMGRVREEKILACSTVSCLI